MNDECRLQFPGGLLTVQDLRELVGWAGSAGSRSYRMGDSQDLVLEGASAMVGPPPSRGRPGTMGSIQTTAFDTGPSATVPWLTHGVWMDLLADLADPGVLDVQAVHEPCRSLFVRQGHLRFTARKTAHQWDLQLRRPGSDRLLAVVDPMSTGDLPGWVTRARQAWESGDEAFWQGMPVRTSLAPEGAGGGGQEGFHRETPSSLSFGFAPPGSLAVDRLRDLARLAADTGVSRVWLTPGRVLLFEGIPASKKTDWVDWLVRNRLPSHLGDLDRSVVAAGWSTAALEARLEVLGFLRAADRMPPSRSLLVADEALNRGDGVSAGMLPLLIRTSSSWLYRTPGGGGSGEGTLAQVLDALDAPVRSRGLGPTPTPVTPEVGERHQCSSCLTVYDPAYGDPRAKVDPGVLFADLPRGWICPVCGAPPSSWVAL